MAHSQNEFVRLIEVENDLLRLRETLYLLQGVWDAVENQDKLGLKETLNRVTYFISLHEQEIKYWCDHLENSLDYR
jgi:hypothetical protein